MAEPVADAGGSDHGSEAVRSRTPYARCDSSEGDTETGIMTEEHFVTAAAYALLWEQVRTEREHLLEVLRDMVDLVADCGALDLHQSRRLQSARALLAGLH